MKTAFANVRAFHLATDVPYDQPLGFPSYDRIKLRVSLIEEEIRETVEAIQARDMPEVADGIADAIYVLIGTAIEFGIPLDLVWDAVQAANMAKVDPVTGKVKRRADGKVLKPDGWTPPDIRALLNVYQASRDH